jgi:hypothetical protein
MFEVIIVLITSGCSLLLLWRRSVRKKMQVKASRTYTCTICNQRHCECLRDFKKKFPLTQSDL